ncbi:MAG: methyltransferase domain-containing protein [Actinomycetota bacterium]|nr:methyltransferase domain-containing protein [Actinomycetota bacterium]
MSTEYWDTRYAKTDQMWSGEPNATLVRETADLPPGTALDVGCGEGADAIWLARRGWNVTAVDVSQVALDRAAELAAGVEVRWLRLDLATSFPDGTFDLVSAHFLHSEVELPREEILRAAASAVAPGGVLLIVGHAGFPPGEHGHHHEMGFPTPAEVLAGLDLPDGQWEPLLSAEHERVQVMPDGHEGKHTDNTLKIRRLPR